MENCLAEIASDCNLSVAKFISLAELIPEQSRAHPTQSDLEREKVCSLMDCKKLSREACVHAAQNDQLPFQTVVLVLYYDQQHLHDGCGEYFICIINQ
ncbi:BTB/POZ domain-containing protein SR1IP1-like [Mangifera indica]|uniref:BTB/POZ domain-containing protein SR1IP1-like n=1 Tax=Mangifera indica TaxID=29780 RepID=UPI001CFB1F22|nr:BTB/POZ domain-containing protein SR1IP1-like [Mangifera indica]